MQRWLILADDLTGANDCAVAFARHGHAAAVVWGNGAAEPGDSVVAVDADSRRLPPDAAAARHRALLEAWRSPGAALFKKIDSTLRGQPAAELAETLAVLREAGQPALAIVAPAFPATGRTTEGGHVRLNGDPLEATPLWARDHTYPTAELSAVLAAAGLDAGHLPLEALRAGDAPPAAALRGALAAGTAAMVCDAATAEDLAAIARATLPLWRRVVWVGTGGLAAALAAAAPGGRAEPPPLPSLPASGGLLLVVGSVAEASRAAAERLLRAGGVHFFPIAPALLRAGPGAEWHAAAEAIAGVLARGEDALVTIGTEPAADLRQGAALTEALAMLLRPAGRRMGGLFATGGETARAVLAGLGIGSIRLLDEVEPGVPLGLTRGRAGVPVVTKAGAFGNMDTIGRARDRMRALLQGRDPE
ncbi:four-carbon acid sugar kinase family protein [Roseomonas sp. M0104]|uniref:Four-carbon acid sugar kinase family protein n=1 Tax=Teichococcus coralli TaxID=2545983 RepID=A0A845BDM0_9PROT|nr:four-carbon acid sugar kinase family protein [Pseudoroseomonas coralli]MXP64216.1 four-carbon acid sugar kinase family protein [Pseudoroseomonas coralli]